MTELILSKRIRQNKKQTQNRINPKQTYQTPSKRKPRVLKPWPQTSLPQYGTTAFTAARLKLLCFSASRRNSKSEFWHNSRCCFSDFVFNFIY